MKISRCKNGHFYDEEVFRDCPHCGVLPPEPDAVPDCILPAGTLIDTQRALDSRRETLYGQENKAKQMATAQDQKSCFRFNEETEQGIFIESAKEQHFDGNQRKGTQEASDVSIDVSILESDSDNAQPLEVISDPEIFLIDKGMDSDSTDKTADDCQFTDDLDMSFDLSCQSEISESYELELPAPDKNDKSSEPLVGWFVLINGEKIEDYRIYSGDNYVVQRKEKIEFLYSMENISLRELFCLIRFDTSSREFEIEPFTENNSVRINGRERRKTVRIASHDAIEIGGFSYLFVALCGAEFLWDQLQ